MTKTCIYVVILTHVFLFAHIGHAQHPFEKESEVFANASDAEKIYLQLSGTTFNTSETIWFKAVVSNVLDHAPTTKSGIVSLKVFAQFSKAKIGYLLLIFLIPINAKHTL